MLDPGYIGTAQYHLLMAIGNLVLVPMSVQTTGTGVLVAGGWMIEHVVLSVNIKKVDAGGSTRESH